MATTRSTRLYPLLVLLCACWTSSASADRPFAPAEIPGATIVPAETVIKMMLKRPPPLLIDTRLHQEYRNGHIEGAVNITDIDLTQEKLAELTDSRNTPIIFYCNGHRCLRSSNACNKAISWGYRKVYWFRTGWAEWTNKSYPVAW
jgi:rhodanese-related sulfurtransferase